MSKSVPAIRDQRVIDTIEDDDAFFGVFGGLPGAPTWATIKDNLQIQLGSGVTEASDLNVDTIAGLAADNAQDAFAELLADITLKINLSAIDTDPALAANSNSKIPSQAAVKAFGENLVVGNNNFKMEVVAMATTGNLATDFDNGKTTDGVVLATGQRFLWNPAVATTAGGIYVVAASGAPTRASDLDSGAEFLGAFIPVAVGGTLYGNTLFRCINQVAPTIGVTVIQFIRFPVVGSFTNGDGLLLTTNVFSADFATLKNSTSLTKVVSPGFIRQFMPRDVLFHGADNAGGAGVNVAAFQAAVNAVPSGTNGFIVVPGGNYADDLSTVTLGTRKICWMEWEGVVYSTAPPPGTRFGTNPLAEVSGIGFGFDRVSESGSGLPNKPTLAIGRDARHTTGVGGTAEPGPLVIRHRINATADNYETSIYHTLDINVASSGPQSYTGGRLQVRKYAAGLMSMFAFNPSTQDTTLRKSSVSGGVMVVQENDWVGLGPDDSNVRSLLDLIGRSIQTADGVDGPTSVAFGIRVIPSRSHSFAPVKFKNAIWIGADGWGSIGEAIHVDNALEYGFRMIGPAPNPAAIDVYHDDALANLRLGANLSAGEIARMTFMAKDAANAKVPVGFFSAQISAAGAGAQTGRLIYNVYSGGAQVTVIDVNPLSDAANPVFFRINGTLRKLEAGAANSGGAGKRQVLIAN